MIEHQIFQTQTLSLLLIEDNQTTVELLIRLLQNSQFNEARITVVESLEKVATQQISSSIDLILLDLGRFRTQASQANIENQLLALPDLPLLVLYDPQDEAFAQTLIRSGIQGFLSKELLTPTTLTSAIHQILQQVETQNCFQVQISALLAKVQQLECTIDNSLIAVDQLNQHITALEGIFSAIPDAIVFADTERRVCKVNPGFNQIFACPSNIVLGQTTEQLHASSAGYQTHGQRHDHPQANGTIGVYEEQYRRQNGEVFVGETVGTEVKDHSGQTLGYLNIIRDISDRKQAERSLAQSEAMNRALLRAIPDRLVWMKSDGTYLQVKGQTFSEDPAFSDATVHDYLSIEQVTQKLHYVQQALQTCELQQYERRIVCNGHPRYEDVRIIPWEQDNVLVMVRDITTQKQAEITLRESQERYQALSTKTPVMLHSIDIDGRLIHVSDYWLEKLGYERHEVIGRKLAEFLSAEIQRCAQGVVLPEYFRTDICSDVPYQIITKGGQVIDVLLSATTERDSSGKFVRSLAVMVDVTERNRAVAALEVSEARFQTFMDNSPALAFMKDADSGQFLYINKPFETFFHIQAADLLGKTDVDWLPPEVAKQTRRNDLLAMQLEQPLQLVETVPDRDGNPQDWLVFKFPCQISNTQNILGGVAINITEQKRLECQLYEEKELAQVTLHSIGDAVITTDAQGCITYFNPVAEKLTGWPQAEARGLPLSEVFIILNEYTREPVENPVTVVLREGIIVGLANHTILISRDGQERGIEDSAAPIRNREGEIIGTVLVFHDVTESRQLSRQLTWQATHDELTQLVNRREFERQLSELLQTAQDTSMLCYLDLDQFKLVNDTCGHPAGDALLQTVADILKNQVRVTDTVARLGGDEFAILLRQCTPEFARRIANLMCQSIREFRFVWGDHSFSIGASIGLVELVPENQNLAEVLAASDAACYAAKEAGRNRIHMYRADDLTLSRQRDQQQWCLRIDRALEDNRFCLYHQPIASLREVQGKPHHTELLLRLISEEGQIIAPMAFIPAAERYHRMQKIDQWVISQFLTNLSQAETDSQMIYNINLSGTSLNDEQFLQFLKDALLHSPVDPARLCFEITETAAISNLTQVAAFMKSLKQLGCQFALDDFGSGMSSFGYLRQLPVDYIKIDGSFIQQLHDPISQAIVDSICKIGRAMNTRTIAERVEDSIAMARLRDLGVDYVQGYGIAKPSPFCVANP